MSGSKIAGWVLSVLLVLFLCFSASGKFADWEGKEKMMSDMGFTMDLIKKIGILEVVIALIFLVPQSAFIAAILITGYLGGAILTHLRIGQPFIFPLIIGILVWVALGLRDSRIFHLAMGSTPKSSPKPEDS